MILTGITAGQAILLGLMAGLALISWIYTFMIFNRALIISAFTGIILGHTHEALVFGAAAELTYLGLINAAGVIPPNTLGPGLFGVILLLNTNTQASYEGGVGSALALSMPFAIFIQFLITIIFTINTPLAKYGEQLIKKEKFLLYRLTGHSTGILLFVSGFAIGIGAGFGYEAMGEAISKIPGWLQTGLSKGGAMLPAMGFAVVLRLMLKKEYTPFLLVGFTLVIIFQAVGVAKPEWGYSLVALAITAAGIALVIFNSSMLSKKDRTRRAVSTTATTGGATDGI